MNVTMRTRWVGIGAIVLLLVPAMYVTRVRALPGYLSQFQDQYPSSGTSAAQCRVCHPGPNGGAAWNPYGNDLISAGAAGSADITPSLIAVEGLDSDGNGISNIVEIQKGAQPGWCDPAKAGCKNPDTPPPVLLDP